MCVSRALQAGWSRFYVRESQERDQGSGRPRPAAGFQSPVPAPGSSDLRERPAPHPASSPSSLRDPPCAQAAALPALAAPSGPGCGGSSGGGGGGRRSRKSDRGRRRRRRRRRWRRRRRRAGPGGFKAHRGGGEAGRRQEGTRAARRGGRALGSRGAKVCARSPGGGTRGSGPPCAPPLPRGTRAAPAAPRVAGGQAEAAGNGAVAGTELGGERGAKLLCGRRAGGLQSRRHCLRAGRPGRGRRAPRGRGGRKGVASGRGLRRARAGTGRGARRRRPRGAGEPGRRPLEPSGALLSDAGGSLAGPGWGLRRRAVRAKAALPDRLEGGRRAPLQPPVRPCSGGGAGPSGAGASQILGSFPLVLLATRLPAPGA